MRPFSEKAVRACELGLILQIALQFIAGGLLATQYHAGSQAYEAVFTMRHSGLWSFLAGVHYWGSSLLIITAFVHLFVLILSGAFRERLLAWYGTIIVFLGAFGAQLTGNVLPMDRHGVQTANIEAGLTASVPVVGPALHRFLLAGSGFTPATAERWFVFHEILITLLLILGAALLWGKGLNRKETGKTALPYLPIAILLVVAALIHPPLGRPATPADYGQFQAYVSWYTLPLHAMTQAFSKLSPTLGWVGFAIIPGLFILVLILLPIFAKKIKLAIVQLIPVLFCLAFLGVMIGFGSPVARLTGSRDPEPLMAHATQTQPANPAQIQLAKLGRTLFNAQGCSSCHGQDGDKGSVGPTLTHESQLESSTWVAQFIRNPKSFRPGTMMPAFGNLTKEQADQIAAWVCLPSPQKKAIQSGQ